MHRRLLPLLALLLAAHPVRAATPLRVLSGGAVEPGLEPAIALFRQATGRIVDIEYATAPRLRDRILGGETPDLLVAPVAVVNELVGAGRLAEERAAIGRVGAGVVVRPGAPEPPIGDVGSLRQAVEQADAVVFNRASTGMYMDRLFERWGITAAVTPKAVRFATGAEVLQRVLNGNGAELGFAAITEIHLVPALRYLGPLPPEVQNYTTYAATLLPNAAPGAAELLRHLTSPAARAALEAGGVEPAG